MNADRDWPLYQNAVRIVKGQTLEEDLELLDSLYGRDNLKYGDTPEAVREEALRQLAIEWGFG